MAVHAMRENRLGPAAGQRNGQRSRTPQRLSCRDDGGAARWRLPGVRVIVDECRGRKQPASVGRLNVERQYAESADSAVGLVKPEAERVGSRLDRAGGKI